MKIIGISVGEVHFKDRLTHKAMKVYNETANRGRMVKEYFDDDGATKVVETPAQNTDAAVDAAMLVMIEKVVVNGSESTATLPWLEDLDERDYLKLVQAFNEVIREAHEGKKK